MRWRGAPGWARHLEGVDAAPVTSREALAKLPVLRKGDAEGPAGQASRRSAASPPRRRRRWRACSCRPARSSSPRASARTGGASARALFAAGFRKGDIVHNTFAYHLTPGGWIIDAGARALGCTVIAAGPGNTEQQLEAIQHLKPDRLCRRAGLPEDPARQGRGGRQGRRPRSRRRSSSGGALFPSLRAEYKQRGIATYQTYATADLGIIAYESAGAGGHDRRRGRDRRDRAARHRRSGAARARSARWWSPPSTATIR